MRDGKIEQSEFENRLLEWFISNDWYCIVNSKVLAKHKRETTDSKGKLTVVCSGCCWKFGVFFHCCYHQSAFVKSINVNGTATWMVYDDTIIIRHFLCTDRLDSFCFIFSLLASNFKSILNVLFSAWNPKQIHQKWH